VICQDCQGRGFSPAFAPVGQAITCPGCGGSGITLCCDGAVGCAAEVPEILTTERRLSEAEIRRIKAEWEKLNTADDTVMLRLSHERRLLVRQELYHAVHTLEAQARVAKPGSTRQRALTRRAADLRSVAEQLA